MQAQGTAPLNTTVIDNLIAEINAVDVCSDLQALVTKAMASLQADLDGISDQLNVLKPIQDLLTVPTDLPSVLTWAQKVINNIITPMYKPYITSIHQLTTLISKIAELTAAIENAGGRIVSCAVSLPALAIPSVPAIPAGFS